MKLISYRLTAPDEAGVRTGVVLDNRVLDISAWIEQLQLPEDVRTYHQQHGMVAPVGGMLRCLQAGPSAIQALGSHVKSALQNPGAVWRPLDQLQLYAPLPRPGKIIGVGRNYADHAKETGVQPFEKPRIIFKMASSVVAPGAPVPRPAGVLKLDYEAELAVVIGQTGYQVSEADALNHVAGYTVLNDVSAREFQFDISPAQTTFAKSMDAFAPMGPWLVTADEVPDPQQLDVLCWLNGAQVQHGHTADMLFPVRTLIAYLSQFMTLEPGDVITTGTPAGIGAFRNPPVYLQPGDRLRLEVTQVGAIEHGIV